MRDGPGYARAPRGRQASGVSSRRYSVAKYPVFTFLKLQIDSMLAPLNRINSAVALHTENWSWGLTQNIIDLKIPQGQRKSE